MIFNHWRRVEKKLPNKPGWYLCTVNFPFSLNYRMYEKSTMILYFDGSKWFEKTRYGKYINTGLKEISENVSYDRTKDVVAWKNSPTPYWIKGRFYVE